MALIPDDVARQSAFSIAANVFQVSHVLDFLLLCNQNQLIVQTLVLISRREMNWRS